MLVELVMVTQSPVVDVTETPLITTLLWPLIVIGPEGVRPQAQPQTDTSPLWTTVPGGQHFSKRWDVQPWCDSAGAIATPIPDSWRQHLGNSLLSDRAAFRESCSQADYSGAGFPFENGVQHESADPGRSAKSRPARQSRELSKLRFFGALWETAP